VPVQPHLQKYFCSPRRQITFLIDAIPCSMRGAFRDRHERWAAGSGGRGCAFDERRVMRTAKSCGPDAPMAGVKFAMMFCITRATVTSKLWSHRGEHDISRKPSRREGRSVSAEPVCSCAFCCFRLHMRPRVQRAPGLPCALYILRADEFAKLGRMLSRESGGVSGDRSPHERSDMRVCRGPACRFAHAGYRLTFLRLLSWLSDK
jgi:hypothetical protein